VRGAQNGIETPMLRRNSNIAFRGMWVFPGGRFDEAVQAGRAPAFELGAGQSAAVREAPTEAWSARSEGSRMPCSHRRPPSITPKRSITRFNVAVTPTVALAIDRGFVTRRKLSRGAGSEEALASTRARSAEGFAAGFGSTDAGLEAMWLGDPGGAGGDAAKAGPRQRLAMRDDAWRS